MTHCTTPYGTWAKVYRDLGFWPRPVTGKQCFEKNWQLSDAELAPGIIEDWDIRCAASNIGLVMGSRFEDGTFLAALDIDNDAYLPLARTLLNDPPCVRIGKKGAALFVRTIGMVGNAKFRVKNRSDLGQVAEFLAFRSLCVISPSIHPDTKCPYRWIGAALHEIHFTNLPIIGE